MKTMAKTKWIGAMALALALACGTARAAVTDGYYEGSAVQDGSGYSPAVAIKTVDEGNGVKSSYALLMLSDKLTSLFRIEEVDESTQAWVQLFQSDDNILSTDISQQATYAVQVGQDTDGKVTLHLATTDFGKRIGCQYDLNFKLTDSPNPWGNLVLDQPAFKTDTGQFSVRSTGVKGEAVIQGTRSYRVHELIPGFGIARSEKLDADSPSGRSIERKISLVFVTFSYPETWARHAYSVFRSINLEPGVQRCAAGTASFSNF